MTKIILVVLFILIVNEMNTYSSRHKPRYYSNKHCKKNGHECDNHSQCCSKHCHWFTKKCSIRTTQRASKRQITYPPGCGITECEKDSDCCEYMSCQHYKGSLKCRWNLNPKHKWDDYRKLMRLRGYSVDDLPDGCSFKQCETDSDCCTHFWCQYYKGEHSCQWIIYPRFDSYDY